MARTHTVRSSGLTLVLLAVMAGAASAQMFVATGRDTLRGLPGLEVVVEDVQPDVELNGVSRAMIQADVVRRLRAAGIAVYSSQRDNPSPAKAYLYVHVNALEFPAPKMYAVALQLQVRQTVRSVVSESQIVDAMTWDAHDVLGVPADRFAEVQAAIQHFVDLFVSDWVAVH
jgi:hypothetical protein